MKMQVRSPLRFKPPIVRQATQGISAFHAYDWYFNWMRRYLKDTHMVFLTPCAATKPIHSSMLHRGIYQKFALAHGMGAELLVVSEPVVLIRYTDLYDLEDAFRYDFPPPLLDQSTRNFFVRRLRVLLAGHEIVGCLPRHHASLINDAVGTNWKNYWKGDIYSMMQRASRLRTGPVSHNLVRAASSQTN